MKSAARYLRPLVYMWAIALSLMSGALYAQQNSPVKRGEPLYKDDNIAIYAQVDNWCYHRDKPLSNGPGLAIIYPKTVPLAQLNNWLNTQYGDFATKVLLPLTQKHQCMLSVIGVGVRFYKDGDSEFSQSAVYDYVSEWSRADRMTKTEYKLTDYSLGRSSEAERAKAQKEQAKIGIWGGTCTGPFCELYGGGYLHAIYANDIAAIRHMDASVNERVDDYINESLADLGALRKLIGNKLDSRPPLSLLTIIADNYLYHYQYYALNCNEGLVAKRYQWTNDTYEITNGYGIYMGQSGGETKSARYVLRPEFVPLCDKVCNALGGESGNWVVNTLNHNASRLTLQGLDDLYKNYRCSSPETRQFERNLVSLTQSYLTEKAQWLTKDQQPSQNDQQQSTEPTTAPPQTRTRAENVPTPTVAPPLENVRAVSERFMAANKKQRGITVMPSGLQYRILREGAGAPPKLGDRVTIYYSSATMDGKPFETTYKSTPFPMNLTYNPAGVKGFIDGILLVKPGGKIKLFIPPDLAFGDQSFGSLPGGSALIYEIELISID